MRDKDTSHLSGMFHYSSLVIYQCEIGTHWKPFKIQDKSKHGLVRLTFPERIGGALLWLLISWLLDKKLSQPVKPFQNGRKNRQFSSFSSFLWYLILTAIGLLGGSQRRARCDRIWNRHHLYQDLIWNYQYIWTHHWDQIAVYIFFSGVQSHTFFWCEKENFCQRSSDYRHLV